jgi:hypothetical protein
VGQGTCRRTSGGKVIKACWEKAQQLSIPHPGAVTSLVQSRSDAESILSKAEFIFSVLIKLSMFSEDGFKALPY